MTADEVLGTEGAGRKEPSKRDRMIDYCRDRLAQAGEDGLEPTPLMNEAVRAVGSKSRSNVYAARAKLAKEVVEFRENPDDLHAPIRWRLKE
jgi:hypothetical protein